MLFEQALEFMEVGEDDEQITLLKESIEGAKLMLDDDDEEQAEEAIKESIAKISEPEDELGQEDYDDLPMISEEEKEEVLDVDSDDIDFDLDDEDYDISDYYAKGGKIDFTKKGGGGIPTKFYWIKMDRNKIDEYINYASRMRGMFEGEIYTQGVNRVAFETDSDRYSFTSMIENHNNDNDLNEGDEGYIHFEELYGDKAMPNIFDRISRDTYAKGGKTPLDKEFKFEKNFVIYVPSTSNVGDRISETELNQRLSQVQNLVADEFGGFTKTETDGGYKSQSGEIIEEDIVKVSVFSTDKAWDENEKGLIRAVKGWAKEWGQEAIGFEYEGDLYYIDATGKMAKGGKTYAEGGDLFEHYERLPDNVQELYFSWGDRLSDGAEYEDLKQMLLEFEELGYTFDYGLDAEPYDLRAIDNVKKAII